MPKELMILTHDERQQVYSTDPWGKDKEKTALRIKSNRPSQ